MTLILRGILSMLQDKKTKKSSAKKSKGSVRFAEVDLNEDEDMGADLTLDLSPETLKKLRKKRRKEMMMNS